MVKSIGYQGRLLEEVYSENQILAMALSLFRKIDDVDFSIIEVIIARKLHFITEKPKLDPKLHELVALLPDDIKIEEKEYGNGSIGYSYYSPTVDKTKRDIEESKKYFERIGLQMSEELFLVMKEIYDNLLELTLKKISLIPNRKDFSLFDQRKNIKYARQQGLLENFENINNAKIVVEAYNQTKVETKDFLELKNRNCVKGRTFGISKKGRVYLLACENEEEVNYVINILFGIGIEGYYFDEYLMHVFDLKGEDISSFGSGISVIDYLEFCKAMGYDDIIKTSISDSKDHGAKTYPDNN